MSLADRLEVPDQVRDCDLAQIGGWKRRPIIRDLLSLPSRKADACPELKPPFGDPPRRKHHFRDVVYVFHVRLEGGERVAVVEGVVPTASLDQWLAERYADAKALEAALKSEEGNDP